MLFNTTLYSSLKPFSRQTTDAREKSTAGSPSSVMRMITDGTLFCFKVTVFSSFGYHEFAYQEVGYAASLQTFAPGSFASSCTWSAQVLTIKRDVKDKKTGVLKPMPPGIFDVGKFCSANGVAFNDYCWEFICSYWMSTFDKANNCFFDMNQQRAAQALRLGCARCRHSSDTSTHPEALSAKHALPTNLAKMKTYFRQG